MKLVILLLTIYFTAITRSFAYLDPGTGSIILQAILGFIAAAITTLSFYWNKVKKLFSKIFKRDKKSEN